MYGFLSHSIPKIIDVPILIHLIHLLCPILPIENNQNIVRKNDPMKSYEIPIKSIKPPCFVAYPGWLPNVPQLQGNKPSIIPTRCAGKNHPWLGDSQRLPVWANVGDNYPAYQIMAN